MEKINYTDKVALNENPSVDDINKVKADDMNEIKEVVNTNSDGVGDLTQLPTTNKTSIVNAIKELYSQIVGTTLWTNPNPHAKFGAQTINVPNLSQYTEIEVFYWNWNFEGANYDGYQSEKVPVANNNAISLSYTIMLNNGTTLTTAHAGGRIGIMNTTNNTIYWRINAGCVINPFNGNADQSWGVPIKIVGYKTPIL